MSFLRPEVLSLLRRWREVIAFAAAALFFLYLIARSASTTSLFWLLILALLAAFFAIAAFHATMRARIGSDGSAQGVVIIDEHRIGYFGPDAGGFVDMQNLTRLDVYNGDWLLHQRDGARLTIPFDAPKADGLLDLFIQLPGVTLGKLHEALSSRAGLLQTIWTASS